MSSVRARNFRWCCCECKGDYASHLIAQLRCVYHAVGQAMGKSLGERLDKGLDDASDARNDLLLGRLKRRQLEAIRFVQFNHDSRCDVDRLIRERFFAFSIHFSARFKCTFITLNDV